MEKAPTPQREVIELTEDRERLAAKLEEYRERIRSRPYDPPELQTDSYYKIAVLEVLLEAGTASRSEVHDIIKTRFNRVDEREFHNAWGVIEKYIYAGGRGLHGGTGLPKTREAEDGEL